MNESLSVLIVDDDISIQNVVEEILGDGGFEPKAASSVEEAIALLNAHRFRAVIIDISFGRDHVKGWAVARRARAFNPALPIIYITGGNTDEWAIQGVPNSILITKPFPPAQLLEHPKLPDYERRLLLRTLTRLLTPATMDPAS
jgi:DNA-binding response OmpR family regulator